VSLNKHWWELARDVILQLKPRRVLDVGAGEGMLWRGFGFAGRHNLRDPRVPFECSWTLTFTSTRWTS
jgi:hypothetical protein